LHITKCYKFDMNKKLETDLEKLTTPPAAALLYLSACVSDATQKTIAEKVGIGQAYVSQLKNEQRAGKVELWDKIAEFFGLNFLQFYKLGDAVLKGHRPMPDHKVRTQQVVDFVGRWIGEDPSQNNDLKSPGKFIFEKKALLNAFDKLLEERGLNSQKLEIEASEVEARFDAEIASKTILDFDNFKSALIKMVESKFAGKQNILAKKAGIPKHALKKLLDNQIMVPVETQESIAEACGYGYESFLKMGQIENEKLRELMFPENKEPRKEAPGTETQPQTLYDVSNPIVRKHHDLLKDFPDPEKGLEMNQEAVELARIDPDEIDEVIKFIRFRKAEAKVRQEAAQKKAANDLDQ